MASLSFLRTPLVCAALLAAWPTIAASAHRLAHYANPRFGTMLDYPSDLFVKPVDADNGDGRRWTSAKGGTLRVYGFWNAESRTPATYAQFLQDANPARYRGVTYRLVKPKLLVLSGSVTGPIFYERYAFGDPSGAVHAVVIAYPAKARSVYDALLPRISGSLKWSKPAG